MLKYIEYLCNEISRLLKKVSLLGLISFLFYSSVWGQPHSNDTLNSTSASPGSSYFTYDLAYTGEVFSNVAGGIKTGTVYMDNFDLTGTLDTDNAGWWEGGTFSIYGLGNQGTAITRYSGDAQGASNIEAVNSWRIYEAWYQHIFFDLKASVLVGLYDLNSEFDRNRSGSLFLNSSHGIGAAYGNSGVTGPSIFPLTSLGIRVKAMPANRFTIKAAVLDGVPADQNDPRGTTINLDPDEGYLGAFELKWLFGSLCSEGYMKQRHRLTNYLNRKPVIDAALEFSIGAWAYSKKQETFASRIPNSPPSNKAYEAGIYALLDWFCLPLDTHNGQRRGLSLFLRGGWANAAASRWNYYLGTGFSLNGFLPNRPDDELGLALAMPFQSSSYRDWRESMDNLKTTPAETNIEATYAANITGWLSLKADLQYIINPGATQRYDNSLVIGGRVIISN